MQSELTESVAVDVPVVMYPLKFLTNEPVPDPLLLKDHWRVMIAEP